MTWHWLSYCLDEALGSLWRRRRSAAFSVLTISAALLVVGSFLLATVNLDRAIAKWSSAAEFSLYLRDDISQDQRVALNKLLAGHPAVASREYVSKADAAERFTRDFPDLAAGLAELPQNPLPASIEVRLRAGRMDAATVEVFAQQVQQAAGVADVRFDRRWLERLGGIVTGVRWAGWLLGSVLIAAAVLAVTTVVRLSLHARRDEVEIMQLMGAPLSLLRGPLVFEGLIQGGMGALLAFAVLYAIYVAVRSQFSIAVGPAFDPALVGFLTPGLSAWLIVGGMGVGCAGGYFAARHVR